MSDGVKLEVEPLKKHSKSVFISEINNFSDEQESKRVEKCNEFGSQDSVARFMKLNQIEENYVKMKDSVMKNKIRLPRILRYTNQLNSGRKR